MKMWWYDTSREEFVELPPIFSTEISLDRPTMDRGSGGTTDYDYEIRRVENAYYGSRAKVPIPYEPEPEPEPDPDPDPDPEPEPEPEP